MSSYVRIAGSDPDARRSSSPEEISVSTVGAREIGTGHHILKVECYSLLKATHACKNGSCIESPEFNAGGHAWKLRCYLNGKTKEDAGFVSVDLCLADAAPAAGADAAAAVHAAFEIALVHHQGTPLRRWRRPHGSALAVCVFGGPERWTSWGYPDFISAKKLERSAFLRHDCFAVRCSVTVVEALPCVKMGAVDVQDVDRLGLLLLCRCDDAKCKRHHAVMPNKQEEDAVFHL